MITLDDLCAHLLPPGQHLKFQTLIIDEPRLILVAAMISANSTCPDCSQPTNHIHGRYWCTLADLPWAMAPQGCLVAGISLDGFVALMHHLVCGKLA